MPTIMTHDIKEQNNKIAAVIINEMNHVYDHLSFL